MGLSSSGGTGGVRGGNHNIELSEIKFTKEKVAREIRLLKKNKAPGEDGLGSTFIKELEEEIAEPLTILFEKSIKEGVVPVDWKVASIVPVFKKGVKNDPGNYRPVSLTSQVGKLMGRVVKRDLVEFVEGNGFIRNSKH